MPQYGLFGDEGMVEGDFYSREEAQTAISERYTHEDNLTIEEVCPEHTDCAKIGCEECEAEEEQEEADQCEDDDAHA